MIRYDNIRRLDDLLEKRWKRVQRFYGANSVLLRPTKGDDRVRASFELLDIELGGEARIAISSRIFILTDEELARTLLERMGLPSDIPVVLPPHDPDDHSTGPPTDQLSFDDMQNLPDYSGPQ